MIAAQKFGYAEVLLRASHLNFSYGETPALRDVNFELKNIVREGLTQGQILSILGRSGCSKTTLIRLIAGLNKPTNGELVLADRTGALLPAKAGRVGLVSQTSTLFEHRTVLGNLLESARLAGVERGAAREKAEGLLSRFGLSDKAGSYPAQLSGGQRQRIAILQPLMQSPLFLCLDEPTSGLDPVSKDQACQLITEVAATDEQMTIIVVTHDIASAAQISDHIWLLGRDRDETGANFIPGSRIRAEFDLASMGLAWQPDLNKTTEFAEFVKLVRERFNGV